MWSQIWEELMKGWAEYEIINCLAAWLFDGE